MSFLKMKKIIHFGFYSILTIVPVYFISFSLKFYYKRSKTSHIPGPRTSGIHGFYLGNLKQIIKEVENGSTYTNFILEWYFIILSNHNFKLFILFNYESFKKYGPVFKLQIFDRIVIHTIEPEAIKVIF